MCTKSQEDAAALFIGGGPGRGRRCRGGGCCGTCRGASRRTRRGPLPFCESRPRIARPQKQAAEAARVAALPWFEREALLAGREPVRRAPSPPATAAPVSEDVPPGVSASTAAAEAEAAPSAKRPLSDDDDDDAAPAKKVRVDDVDPALDPKKLKRLKVEELRAALEGLGCDTEGTKPTLVERLIEARAASAAPEPVEMEAEPSPADAPAAAEPAANADADPKKLKPARGRSRRLDGGCRARQRSSPRARRAAPPRRRRKAQALARRGAEGPRPARRRARPGSSSA